MNIVEARQAIITAHPTLDDPAVERAAKRLVNVEAIAQTEADFKAFKAEQAEAVAQEQERRAEARAEMATLSQAELSARINSALS